MEVKHSRSCSRDTKNEQCHVRTINKNDADFVLSRCSPLPPSRPHLLDEPCAKLALRRAHL